MTEIYLNIIFEYRQATFHHFSNISYLSPTSHLHVHNQILSSAGKREG
jgi:hypothetical protein